MYMDSLCFISLVIVFGEMATSTFYWTDVKKDLKLIGLKKKACRTIFLKIHLLFESVESINFCYSETKLKVDKVTYLKFVSCVHFFPLWILKKLCHFEVNMKFFFFFSYWVEPNMTSLMA